MRKQKNVIYNQEENQSIETNLEMEDMKWQTETLKQLF